MTNFDRLVIQGKEEDIKIIGSDDQYAPVRNLVLLAGRFLDPSDVSLRHRVVLLTDKLATRLYGSHNASLGQILKLYGLQFTVLGVFKEKTDSFGQTELSQETALIPISVIRNFATVERIDPLYVQARTLEDVRPVTERVRTILESRHRPGAKYTVENLAAILDTAYADHRDSFHRAGPGGGDFAGHLGNRHHEYHAGDSDRAHAGDRRAIGGGCDARRRVGAVSGGGGVDQPLGRDPGDRTGVGRPGDGPGALGRRHSCLVDRRRRGVFRFLLRRARLRNSSRQPRFSHESDRSASIRIARSRLI